MEWTLSYILSQIFSVLGFTCYGTTFFSKSQKKIRFLGILMNVFLAISYLLLNETSGWVMLIIATIRNIVFFKLNKKEYTTSYKLILFILLLTIVITGVITYKDVYSLLPVFGMIFYSIGVWQKSPKIYKLLCIPNGLVWIIYDILIASIVTSIGEFIMLMLAIIGFVGELRNEKFEINNKNKSIEYVSY